MASINDPQEIIPTIDLEHGNKLVDMWVESLREGCGHCGEPADVESITLGLLPDVETMMRWRTCTGEHEIDEPGLEICGEQILHIQSAALLLAVALRRLASVK